ncbi:MAG TPA: hypothetical protein VKZ82_16920 [Nonomuraea sp.]|uniref:hypothetical protein n=1 Tax=Nonomuraea sp. NPDC049649 TaxID=3155776 RepID=UPI002CE85E08|nr:hypothetical protein [Nonomuraea sp.]
MNSPRHGIAGFTLTEHTWITELGNWIDAISPDGRRAGALLFDSTVIGRPGVRDRVVEAALTDRRLVMGGLTGLIPVADVVAAGDQVWLLTAQAVTPTLSSLLAAGTIEASGAAAVLADTAQTLLALHAAGVTHGSVHPGTVVVTAEGAALLSERGLGDAIRGENAQPVRDVSGWAALARGLAAACRRDTPQAAALFERAAAVATTQGPAAARSVLLAEPHALPGGAITRDRLAQAARGQSAFAQAPSYRQEEERDEGDIVTLLHVPRREGGTAPRGQATTHPSPGGAEAVRFGPGVGAAEPQSAAERIWREGVPSAKAARARRRRAIGSALVFAVVMAGAAVAWFRLTGDDPPVAVEQVSVSAAEKTLGCDSDAFISGTIDTNGGAGEIRYEWRMNLAKDVEKGTLRAVAGTTSYDVDLTWRLQGKRTTKATATLRVTSPGPARTAKATFTYKC